MVVFNFVFFIAIKKKKQQIKKINSKKSAVMAQ